MTRAATEAAHMCTRPRATPLLKISLAPQGASTHVANSGGGRRMGGLGPDFTLSEAEREQPVLLAHGPRTRKAEPLAQPQHGLKPLDRAPGRVEGLEAANPRHRPLDPEVVALNPLLQVLADVMHRRARQPAILPSRRDGGWVGPRTIGADPVGGEPRLLLQHLA